ncbi:MAG: LysR family transcriptional regulator [Treponema sp.]|jgi:lysyl-tRNA synthetase class 2|nr:LysR family transcriptional regulator [Treponema sp.]
MDLEMLQERARIIRQIRSFFDGRDYLELDTPLMSPNLIPESCLEVFETRRILPAASRNPATTPYWLIPSPEIWMKKIIAQHRANVYQVCKCFRNGESSGFLHSPEFTMLEYYTMDADYTDSLKLTEELFDFLAPARFSLPFERITVAEAFSRYAGFNLFAAAGGLKATDMSNKNFLPRSTTEFHGEKGKNHTKTPWNSKLTAGQQTSVMNSSSLETEARRLGLDPPPGMGAAELYDLIFIHAVEPQLKRNQPIALLDYPAFVPCLARRSADGKTVERWELYYNGIELANCYSEETNAQRVQDFFESESAAKEKQALVHHQVDRDYPKLFEGGTFPPCSGVALGLDRLIMALCERSTIDGVLPFPMG